MTKFLRACGVAAAALTFVASASIAGPSIAAKADAAPAVSAIDQHAMATIATDMTRLADAALPKPRSVDELVDAYAESDVVDEEQDCLASAVYFEARGEPITGQLAVAEVVLNRSKSGRYPSTICGVVVQPWQFSFVNATGSIPPADRSSDAWRKAVAVARIAQAKMAGELSDEGVLWYHADYVAPVWRKALDKKAKVGLHIFYS